MLENVKRMQRDVKCDLYPWFTTSIDHHLEKEGRSESGSDVRVALLIYGTFDC